VELLKSLRENLVLNVATGTGSGSSYYCTYLRVVYTIIYCSRVITGALTVISVHVGTVTVSGCNLELVTSRASSGLLGGE
jgi:hypothetical protein